MEDLIIPLGFMGAIAGFVTLGVLLNVFQGWAKHRFMDHSKDDVLALMEARLTELEERVDFAERALAQGELRPPLISGTPRPSE